MPKLSFSVEHQLGQQEAVDRMKSFMPKIREHYQGQLTDFEESWEENELRFGFSTFGFKIKGQMAVEDTQVKLDLELPFAAMMFKGKIEQSIREPLERMLR